MEEAIAVQRPPTHLRVVGIVALLWNSLGAVDYLMTRTHNDGYLRTTMPEVEPSVVYGWVEAMPWWAQAGWGLGVWAAFVGSILLLMRSRHAVVAFALSLVGMVVSFGQQYFGDPPPPPELGGGAMQVMPLVIFAIGVALLTYARAMKARGLLR